MISKRKILTGSAAAFLLIIILSAILVKSLIRNRIETMLAEKRGGYSVTAEKIHISIITRGMILERIRIVTTIDSTLVLDINGEIGSIKLRGINLAKAIFKKEISIKAITVSDSYIKGRIESSRKAGKSVILPLDISLGTLLFDKIILSLETDQGVASYYVKDGNLIFDAIQAEKLDTLNTRILNPLDFRAKEIVLISADSMYSYLFRDIKYSANSKILGIDSFSIHPDYDDYNFTARYKFQKSLIEAGFSNISVHDFNPSDYIRSGTIASSVVEIGKMDMKVFKDKRKEFHHLEKAAFQDIIYRYPDTIRIDLIDLSEGNITYTEHAEGANEHGSLSFTGTSARIYNIANDTIYKTETGYFKLEAESMLMGKGKVTIQLKAKLYDDSNTFSVNGKLAAMEVQEINPFLEKTAFIYATSGKIEEMNFSFIADNTQAKGKMTMLYTGLDLALKNKKSDDTTAFKERIFSIFINRKVLDSNPLPNNEIREGIIAYERDPEKFLFSYFAKSIMSGVRSSLLK